RPHHRTRPASPATDSRAQTDCQGHFTASRAPPHVRNAPPRRGSGRLGHIISHMTVMMAAVSVRNQALQGMGHQLFAGVAEKPYRLSIRSEEHTSELQSRENLGCRLLLEKKN